MRRCSSSEKCSRLQEIRDTVEGVIIDENGAEQGLLRLDIMRGDPERRLAGTGKAQSIG